MQWWRLCFVLFCWLCLQACKSVEVHIGFYYPSMALCRIFRSVCGVYVCVLSHWTRQPDQCVCVCARMYIPSEQNGQISLCLCVCVCVCVCMCCPSKKDSQISVCAFPVNKTARSVCGEFVCICAFSINMPNLIHIWSGSAQKCWPVAGQLASGPDPFGQNLTKNRIQAGFAQLDPGHLWKNTTESESGKLVVGWLRFATTGPDDYFHTSLLPDQIHHAKIWPSHAGWIWVCFEWYDLGRLWRMEPNQIREVRSGPILAARWQ